MKIETAPKVVRREPLNPILIMLTLLVAAVFLTHVIPAGKFQRQENVVVAGTYQSIDKINGLPALLAPMPPQASDQTARAGGVVGLFTAIPAGISKGAGLIFMVFFVGGMFGVLRATGAVDAGVDRLLYLTSGNVYVLTTGLMLVIACGSSFFGFISEYVAILPLVMIVGQRLGLPNLFGLAVVGVASKVGYAASVANPVSLAVAQPLAGVPVFSGLGVRMAIFAVMMTLAIGYVLLYLKRLPKAETAATFPESARLTKRQVGVLLVLLAGGAFLLTGARLWNWHHAELASFFIALSMALAVVGGTSAVNAADAFLDGMKSTLMAGLLIGFAGAAAVILQSSQVLDSIVQGLTNVIQGHAPGVVAAALMTTEMVLDFAVPSLAAKAAISLPILTPIAQLNGVSGQVTVTALLLGSGLNHLISPTSAVLLAFLSISKVSYGEWIKFIVPLWAMLCGIGYVALFLMTAFGA